VNHSAPKAQKLDGIQFGRAAAAMLVVCYHAGRMLALPQYLGHFTTLGEALAFGNAGVDFFFTLSGFIIFYVHQSDIGRPSRLGHYIWRRLTRIYPMYWVATAIILVLAILKHDWASLNVGHIFRSVFLIPSIDEPLLGVGWTLTHEIFFYAVFAVAIVSRPIGSILALLWGLLIIAGFHYDSKVAFLRFVQSPYHLQFAFGIFSAAAISQKSPGAWIVFVSGFLLFIGTSVAIDLHHLSDNQIISRFLFGGGSALILYGIAAMEMRGHIKIPRWAAFLGAASYSIYLFHTIAIGFFAKVAFQILPIGIQSNGVFIATVLVATVVGCGAYQFVEVPLRTQTRKLRSLSKMRIAPTA
jgi:exopolysaccharide production protein ExoZ